MARGQHRAAFAENLLAMDLSSVRWSTKMVVELEHVSIIYRKGKAVEEKVRLLIILIAGRNRRSATGASSISYFQNKII